MSQSHIKGFTLIQVMVAIALLGVLSLLFTKQFAQMTHLQSFLNSGQDAAVLAEDLRLILQDPMRCIESVRIKTRENSRDPMALIIGLPKGEAVGGETPPQRYSLKSAEVKVVSSRLIFESSDQNEFVWEITSDLNAQRSSGETLKPKPLGTVYLRADANSKISGCSADSRTLMRCKPTELLQMNVELKHYECKLISNDYVKNPCPDGMEPDLTDKGRTCISVARTPEQLAGIELTNEMQSFAKDPMQLMNPSKLVEFKEKVMKQLEVMCTKVGGQWSDTGCHQ